MTTLTSIASPLADSWQVSIGGGWIIVMLIGMALCFVFMFGFMRLMGGGHGWPMCGRWWQQEPRHRDAYGDTPVRTPGAGDTPEREAGR